MHPCDVWLMIEARQESLRESWEQTRVLAYHIAKFGNSDPKSFPRTMKRFWSFEWDDNSEEDEIKNTLFAAARQLREKNQRHD